MACIITGAELFDEQSCRWVHGDLHRVGDAYVFNAVLDEKGEAAWTEGEPEGTQRVLQVHGYYFERRGLFVCDRTAASLNKAAREYVEKYA
jgi:hypothetical protein